MAIELDAGELTVMSHAKIASNSEITKRCLGGFHLFETLGGHRGTIW